MADAAQPYDSNKGPVKEAAADAANIRIILEKEGADSAVTRLRSEVDSVPDRDRQAYNTALLKNLQGDGRMPNILPDMAVAFGMQNSGDILGTSSKPWVRQKIVDGDKITAAASRESNPVYQELYRELGMKYRSLRSDNANNGSIWETGSQKFTIGGANVFESQMKEQLRLDGIHAENRKNVGLLAAHPTLFNDLASGGEITMDSIKSFQDKWNQPGASGDSFRKKYGTYDQQKRIGDTVENLRQSFDDDRNKRNQAGSLLKDNVSGVLPSAGMEWFSSYGKMTKDSLLDGLGYKSFDEAKKRLPPDAGGKPIPDVTSLSNYDNTKLLGKKDGPYGVASRMLSGQDQFFTNETGGISKAITDLSTAIGPSSGNYDDRQVNQVKPENRDAIIKSIEATGNTRLRDWFVSRYPSDMSAVNNSSTGTSGPIDNSSSKVVSRQGPDAVAKNMLEGSGLDGSARQALSRVLYKDIGVDWNSVRAGTPLINPDGNNNLEMVRDKITATNNSALINWFNNKYPR